MAKKAFALRLDDKMLSALQRWADDEFRSVNGQIEYLLHEALRKAGRLNVKQQDVNQQDLNEQHRDGTATPATMAVTPETKGS